MLTALTFTPRTSTRRTSAVTATSRSMDNLRRLRLELLGDLRLDPCVGARDAVLERNLRLPAEDLAQLVVVRVAAAHTLRTGHVLLGDADAGDVGHHVGQVVDADQAILTKVDRILVPRLHEQPEALDAVVDVAERARLLAVTPHFDIVVAGQL